LYKKYHKKQTTINNFDQRIIRTYNKIQQHKIIKLKKNLIPFCTFVKYNTCDDSEDNMGKTVLSGTTILPLYFGNSTKNTESIVSLFRVKR